MSSSPPPPLVLAHCVTRRHLAAAPRAHTQVARTILTQTGHCCAEKPLSSSESFGVWRKFCCANARIVRIRRTWIKFIKILRNRIRAQGGGATREMSGGEGSRGLAARMSPAAGLKWGNFGAAKQRRRRGHFAPDSCGPSGSLRSASVMPKRLCLVENVAAVAVGR